MRPQAHDLAGTVDWLAHSLPVMAHTDPQSLLNSLLADLRAQVDASYRDRIATLFNVDVQDFLGVPTPKVRQLSGQYSRQLRPLSLPEVLGRCEVLLQ